MFSQQSLQILGQLIAQVSLKASEDNFLQKAQAIEQLKKEYTQAVQVSGMGANGSNGNGRGDGRESEVIVEDSAHPISND